MINGIIKKNGVTYGILTGTVSVLITTSIYLIDWNLFVSRWVGVLEISIHLIIGIVLLLKTKKELNGIFTFKEAFTTYFINAVIGILIVVLYNIILFNLINPSAQDTLTNIAIKDAVETMQKFKSSQIDIDKMIIKMRESYPYSVTSLLKGAVFSIVFKSILGLIMAAFFKGKPQE